MRVPKYIFLSATYIIIMSKSNILSCTIMIIVIMCIFYSNIYHWIYLEPVASTHGGVYREWNVVSNYENSADAANLMSRSNATAIEFMRVLKKKYHVDEAADMIEEEGDAHLTPDELPNDTYNMVVHLLRNYNPDEFYENDPQYSKDTSYTINKGATTHLCLRNRTSPDKLVDDNTLLFVVLHEMSHVANYNDMGHSTQFWEVFKFILHEAQLAGVYQSFDYKRYPKDYCGLIINYQPLNDHTLRNLWE